MEGRKDQLVEEGIMQTAAVAPPEPDERPTAWNEQQQQQGDSQGECGPQSEPEPSSTPSPG